MAVPLFLQNEKKRVLGFCETRWLFSSFNACLGRIVVFFHKITNKSFCILIGIKVELGSLTLKVKQGMCLKNSVKIHASKLDSLVQFQRKESCRVKHG